MQEIEVTVNKGNNQKYFSEVGPMQESANPKKKKKPGEENKPKKMELFTE